MVIVGLLILGLCLGSFVNALVWRLHEQSKTKSKKRLNDLSITKGRSLCPHCGHQLASKDLIPVVSWLSLGGKCRYCKKSISWQYPLIELIGGVLLVASYIWWPYAGSGWSFEGIVAFGIWTLIATGFLALAVYDIRWYLLPDKIVFPLTFLGLLFVGCIALEQNSWVFLRDAVLGAATIFGLFYLLLQLSKGAWIGGGDVKLAVLLGLLAGGFLEAFLLLFLASILGTAYALVLGISGKKTMNLKLRIPFGPFLITAAVIVVLFGTNIINWYSDLILSV